MNYILFDGTVRNALLPFTFTRPVADIRVGILTIREKWEKYLGYTTTTITEEYLMDKYPMVEMEENIMINASFLPNEILVEMVESLEENQAIFYGDEVIAFYTKDTQEEVDFDSYEVIEYTEDLLRIENPWDIFKNNDAAIREASYRGACFIANSGECKCDKPIGYFYRRRCKAGVCYS